MADRLSHDQFGMSGLEVVVFSLPEGILQRLIADLAFLASSYPATALRRFPHFSTGANPQEP
jgi:hypothetical protein